MTNTRKVSLPRRTRRTAAGFRGTSDLEKGCCDESRAKSAKYCSTAISMPSTFAFWPGVRATLRSEEPSEIAISSLSASPLRRAARHPKRCPLYAVARPGATRPLASPVASEKVRSAPVSEIDEAPTVNPKGRNPTGRSRAPVSS